MELSTGAARSLDWQVARTRRPTFYSGLSPRNVGSQFTEPRASSCPFSVSCRVLRLLLFRTLRAPYGSLCSVVVPRAARALLLRNPGSGVPIPEYDQPDGVQLH